MVQKLLRVERGNVVLRVPDYDVQRFIDQGYNLVDEDGNIIQASVPRDLGTLQKMYTEHIEEIKRLKAEVEKLQSKLVEKETENEVVEKPKRTRAKKSE